MFVIARRIPRGGPSSRGASKIFRLMQIPLRRGNLQIKPAIQKGDCFVAKPISVAERISQASRNDVKPGNLLPSVPVIARRMKNLPG